MLRRVTLSLLASVLMLAMMVGTPVGRRTAAGQEASPVDALDIDPATVLGHTVNADPASVLATGTALGGFPTQGSDYLILSTGQADSVAGGDPSEFISTDLASAAAGADGNDLTQLRVRLKPPGKATCIAFDFRFLSEEYPEYVGSAYNDIFTAELNESLFTVDGNQVVAPNNFAFDSEGAVRAGQGRPSSSVAVRPASVARRRV